MIWSHWKRTLIWCFKDFQTDRRQVVKAQSTLSDPCDIPFAVRLLLIIDLSAIINKYNILLYADDAVMFAAHKEIKILGKKH